MESLKLWFRNAELNPHCSWSIVYKELVKACLTLGYQVHSVNTPPKFPHQWIEVWWGAPDQWEWSTKQVKKRVGISLSESDQLRTDTLGEALAALRQCDILFVPCESAKQAFLQMPIDIPIMLWPFGVDPDVFRYQPIDFDTKDFSFLHLGATQFRKGSWLVPEAFIRSFSDDDAVTLTIASYDKTEMMTQLQEEYASHNQIRFVVQAHPVPTTHYHGHHVLVSPHLAEGWGMCITEAMALGMPSIVSRCSAPREYFSSDFGWWVEMSDDYAPVSTCLPGANAFWRLPDVNDLADKMQYVYTHRDECADKGRAAAVHVRKQLTWVHGAEVALNHLCQQ